jgi:hypothetical protein
VQTYARQGSRANSHSILICSTLRSIKDSARSDGDLRPAGRPFVTSLVGTLKNWKTKRRREHDWRSNCKCFCHRPGMREIYVRVNVVRTVSAIRPRLLHLPAKAPQGPIYVSTRRGLTGRKGTRRRNLFTFCWLRRSANKFIALSWIAPVL